MDFTMENSDSYGLKCFWRIENFWSYSGLSIKSPYFNMAYPQSQWNIMINDEGNHLGAYLFGNGSPLGYSVGYSIYLLKGTDWVFLHNGTYEFGPNTIPAGTDKLLCIEKLKNEPWTYLPNASLNICFHIYKFQHINPGGPEICPKFLITSRLLNKQELSHIPIEYFYDLELSDLFKFLSSYNIHSIGDQKKREVKPQMTQTEAMDDYEDAEELLEMFKENNFSFVTLRTSNRDFLVHKAVLCAKSPVFNAMFQRQMKENVCNLVEINDIDSQTMVSVVKFLHFLPLDDLNWESAVCLYYAADKYQIDMLKKECVKLLEKELSVENVCDALLLADLHQDKDLMICSQEYFAKNLKQILTSNQWKNFLCHTEIVAKVLHKLAENM